MKALTTLFAVLALGSFAVQAADGDKPKAKMDPAAMFKKKDANADSKLSKEEFTKGAKDAAKAEAAFTAKDKDKDGSLTIDEFKAGPGKKAPK